MRVRRGYLLLGLCGLGLLALDHTQRSLYITQAPVLASEFRQGDKGPLLQAILISGQGLDEAETATSRRDVARCTEALKEYHAGRLQITTLVPGRPDSTSERALELISTRNCDHLVIFMTGHGGGRNFGGVGGLNLTRDAFAKALGRSQFQRATVVIDCCWSGEFARSLEQHSFPGQVALVTSTDASHPSPFPVSFLSFDSFGKTYFENWSGDDAEAFRRTNAQRKKLKWFYSQRFGLLGVHKVL